MKHLKFHNRSSFPAGHIRIAVSGQSPERFVNACVREKIEFRKLKKVGNEFYLTVMSRNLETAEQLALRLMLDIRVVSKSAVLHISVFVKRRLCMFCVLIVSSVILVLSQSMVLNIEIEGNEIISDERILWALRQEGIGVGTFVSKIDPQWLKPRVLLKIPELSWFYINIKGTTANVNVREHTQAPKVVDEKQISDLVANKSGMVEKVEVHSGSACVKAGDMVSRGDVLISSKVESKYIAARYVRAAGTVSGTTWYTVKLKIPLTVTAKALTGRESTKKSIIFSGKRINLSIQSGIPYMFYDKITSYENFSLPGGYSPPVTLVSETYKELEIVESKLDRETAVNCALECIRDLVEAQLDEDGVIDEIKSEYTLESEALVVKAYIQCSEKLTH